ncbi:MAG TPA: lysophospholipid acyltransferase family protein [Gammaproteobacteria bacterium]|nr:lysophospholipid acyltransferase family protein [Gammaproteobacteria bacterium]
MAKHICGIRYEIEGLENLPATNAVVLCNHQSTWETLFLQTLLPMQTWVLKKELLWIPFFGWGLGLLQPIAIDRNKKSSIKSLMETGRQRLTEGRYIIVFPEGTRLKPGEQRKYSRSGAALAQATSSYILPIAHNAGNFWPKNSFLKYPGVIKVCIGKVLDPKHFTVDSLTQSAQEWIYSQVAEA